MRSFVCLLSLLGAVGSAAEPAVPAYTDKTPQRYHLAKRASEIDPRAREHPEIDFVFKDKAGKPQDAENAVVDTRVAPRGRVPAIGRTSAMRFVFLTSISGEEPIILKSFNFK